MPLVFSPLNEETISTPPKRLLPRHAFLMRQLGEPPAIDAEMAAVVREVFEGRGRICVDADDNVGGGDFLERILGLIRSTGFTIAVFSEETRPTAFANISLELGFAAMCGKPLVIVKSRGARAPSDLTRTDWIEYDPVRPDSFRRKLRQAADQIDEVVEYEHTLLMTALAARNMDCAVAFERANKGWLLSGDARFIDAAQGILDRLAATTLNPDTIDDLSRLINEIRAFIRMARRVV